MWFVILVHWGKKPTKADEARVDQDFAEQEKMGIRTFATYSTFGRYDAVRIVEAPDEKTLLKALMKAPDWVHTETLLAIKREDAAKLAS